MRKHDQARIFRRSRAAVAAAAASLLTACAVGPDYHPPKIETSDHFLTTDAQFAPAAVEDEFWSSFNDTTLNTLIEQALRANHDIRIATARLREARALHGQGRLDFGPAITASAQQVRSHASELSGATPAADRDQDYYQTGFDALWELDLFGRIRRTVEAQSAVVEAAEAGVHATEVSITAEVARNYFELRGAQQRLEVARRNADNQRETLRITTARLDAGRGTLLDTSRAQAQLSATLATIPDLEAALTRSILRLGVLTGRLPQAQFDELARPQSLPALPAVTNIGTPDLLLRRRPDIRVAERELAAATARIGIAVADLFPRVTFIGRWGFSALQSSGLGEPGSESYAFGPSIRWAAFDLGRVRQRIQQQQAAAAGTLARYEQVVLEALEETDASLTTYAKAMIQRQHLKESALASRQAASLARTRYENGAADFLAVLDAERSALAAEDQLAQSETRTATALLAAYKALGGGFRPLQ